MDTITVLLSNIQKHRCAAAEEPYFFLNLSLSIFILLGILISYLPQHYRIIARGTSEGISPYFILLGATSGTCAFANILVLPASRADIACCKTTSTFECLAGLLGMLQVGVQWFCFTVILLLFLVFFPRGPSLPTNEPEEKYTWKTAVSVAFVCLLHGLLTVLVSVVLLASKPHLLGTWANTLGLTATSLAAVQYLPQIWMTWHLGHVGSLSIPMMCIQTPGSFVWSASLAARLGVEGWSSWGTFLVTGCLQGCLLVMGISFEIKARRTARELDERGSAGYLDGEITETDDEGGANIESIPSERSPLIKKNGKPPRSISIS